MNYKLQSTKFLQHLLFDLTRAANAAGVSPNQIDDVRVIKSELIRRKR